MLAVDDQQIFRSALRDLIAATPGFELAGEAATGPEAIQRVHELDPDIVLLDVRMPGMDGYETARRLTAAEHHPLVVLVSLDTLTQSPKSCGATACVRKQDLSTATLPEIWAARPGAA